MRVLGQRAVIFSTAFRIKQVVIGTSHSTVLISPSESVTGATMMPSFQSLRNNEWVTISPDAIIQHYCPI